MAQASGASVAHRRWHVASRVCAAVLPGYVLANSFGLFLAQALPVSRVSGVAAGTMATFLVWGLAAMWVFAVRRTHTAWLGLLGATAVTGATAWLLYLVQGPA